MTAPDAVPRTGGLPPARAPHLPGRRVLAVLVAALTASVTACTPSGAPGATDEPRAVTVTVLAAASLTEPFTALARRYELDHPGVRVRTSFGSSAKLAQQVAQGAPADLVALAGIAAVEQLPQGSRDPSRRTVIARNVLEIATPPDDPAGVSGLADLARPDVAVVLCVETAPCGAAADEVLARAGVAAHVVSREVDVRATLAKIGLGEADAAIVYHSDVVGAGARVRGVVLPPSSNTTLDYPLVRLSEGADAAGFAALVASDEGRRALADAGFLAP